MTTTKTIVLCGVGGQGTITAADLLARAALAAGHDVKVSEIHGMAQRGGAVSTIVRYGERVDSMVADRGSADAVVAFESLEALRNISYLKPDGFLLVSDDTIKPLPVACGWAEMPSQLTAELEKASALFIASQDLALQAGNVKCENVVLLGALETVLQFGFDVWKSVIEKRVPPKTIDANIAAFTLGFDFAKDKH